MKLGIRNSGLILGLALLLFACEDPGTIGIDVESANLEFDVKYKRFVLPATLIQIDSIPTNNSSRLLTGSYADPKFGFSSAIGYCQVLRRNKPSINENAEYDSLFLQLKYEYVHGTEIKAENTLKVHRLEEDIDGFATYYSFKTFDYSDDPIGEITFKYPLNDREEVRLDTVLRVPLSDDLGIEFFDKMRDENDSTFDSFDNWLEYFKGIVLVGGENYQTITGFNTKDDNSKMILYYHFPDTDGEILNRTIEFSTSDGLHSNSFENDRTDTPLREITDFYTEYAAIDSYLYVQSGTGLVAKIDFSEFINFTDTIETLVINRADLTLGIVESFPTYLVPSESLIFYLTDSTNRRILAEDGAFKTIQEDNPLINPAGTRFPLQSTFIEDDQIFTDPMATFLQALFEGVITETQALTFPSFSSNSKTFDRFILNPENVILEVYFSVPNPPSNRN